MAAAIKANSGTVWRAESTALIEGYSSEEKSTSSSSSFSSSTGCRLDKRESNLPETSSNKLRIRKRPVGSVDASYHLSGTTTSPKIFGYYWIGSYYCSRPLTNYPRKLVKFIVEDSSYNFGSIQ
ncbi:hypothetical protein YC2023_101781 [Brassica napus]